MARVIYLQHHRMEERVQKQCSAAQLRPLFPLSSMLQTVAALEPFMRSPTLSALGSSAVGRRAVGDTHRKAWLQNVAGSQVLAHACS